MADRMQDSTAATVQAEILDDTKRTVRAVAARGAFEQRMDELDREWDAERVLFTASGINVLLGLALGRWVDRRWYGYVAGVAAFQVQHGIQGWCPPMALIRRLKVRTRKEIDEERVALKALRGDFRKLPKKADADDALNLAHV